MIFSRSARRRSAGLAAALALTVLAPAAQASLPDSGGKVPPSVVQVAVDSQRYPETGYCAASGLGTTPSWAGAFPFWNADCPDVYEGGIDQQNNLVLGNTLFNGTTYRIRVWDLGTRTLRSSRNLSIRGWSAITLHVGSDGRYYLVLGRGNPNDNPDLTTVAVKAYTPSLQLVGTAKVPGGIDWAGIGGPGDTHADTVLQDGILLVHSSRFLFARPGEYQRHQSNLTFAVDTSTMKLVDPEALSGATYTSHSLAQHAGAVGDDAVFVDHGDAYPRAVQLTVIPDFWRTGAEGKSVRSQPLLRIWPSKAIGENYTGTTVNDIATGTSRVLTVGTSLPHGKAVRGITGIKRLHAPNVYLASTDVASGTTTWRWLTTFDPRTRRAVVGEPRVVRISDNRFALLYHVETNHDPRRPWYNGRLTLVYRLLNQNGTTLARQTWPGYWFMPETRLFFARNRVWWQAGYLQRSGGKTSTREYLFGLNVTDPRRPFFVRG